MISLRRCLRPHGNFRHLWRRCFASELNFEDYGLYPPAISQLSAKEAKKLAVQLEAMHDDKYATRIMARGPWDTTKDPEFPNLVTSDYSTRLIGCVCDVQSKAIHYMRLEKGQPMQCPCGYWYKLVDDDPDYKLRLQLPTMKEYTSMLEGVKNQKKSL